MDAVPRSLLGWPAFFWSRVLFAGPSTAHRERPSPFRLVCLFVLPAILLYPCLSYHLLEPDESRYAQIPAEMLARGDLIVPTLQGEPYLDKPPLFYWLVMLCYRVFGVHDWSARLVPALAVHGTILCTYLLGRRSMGERTAWYAALLLAIAPGFLGMGRLLLLDGLLTLFVVASLFGGFEAIRSDRFRWSWWLVASVCCALGVLTKGPIAILLLVPPLWLFRRMSGHAIAPGLRGWAALAGIVLLIALPWYVGLSLRIPSFVSYFFWEHNVQRFLAPGVHVRGVWFYLPVLALALLPGSLLLGPIWRLFFSEKAELACARSPELGFHLLASGWCLFFFTLSACKLPTYILPGVPFLALILGHALAHAPLQSSRWTSATAMTSLVVVALTHFVALPWYAWYRSPMNRPDEVIRLCAAPEATVVCYPRNCDSIAFYCGRHDLKTYRSKQIEELRELVRSRPRTVILCTHRHSLRGLKQLLPPEVKVTHERRMGLTDIPGVPPSLMRPLRGLMGETALGLGDLAVVERSAQKPSAVSDQRSAKTQADALARE